MGLFSSGAVGRPFVFTCAGLGTGESSSWLGFFAGWDGPIFARFLCAVRVGGVGAASLDFLRCWEGGRSHVLCDADAIWILTREDVRNRSADAGPIALEDGSRIVPASDREDAWLVDGREWVGEMVINSAHIFGLRPWPCVFIIADDRAERAYKGLEALLTGASN